MQKRLADGFGELNVCFGERDCVWTLWRAGDLRWSERVSAVCTNCERGDWRVDSTK